MDGYAFTTALRPSMADAGMANGRVRQSKFVDYFLDALWDWIDSLVNDFDLEPQPATEARIEVDYLAPLLISLDRPRPELEVSLRCARIGTTSYTIESAISEGEHTLARVACRVVILDAATGASAPISDRARAAFVAAHERAGLTVGT